MEQLSIPWDIFVSSNFSNILQQSSQPIYSSLLWTQVKEVIYTFEFIFLTHIYKEFKTHVDSLSKEILTLQDGTLVLHEYKETLSF